MLKHRDFWPVAQYPDKGSAYVPPEAYPAVTHPLLDRGYGQASVRAILGENFLRVAGQVWKQTCCRSAWRQDDVDRNTLPAIQSVCAMVTPPISITSSFMSAASTTRCKNWYATRHWLLPHCSDTVLSFRRMTRPVRCW